MGRLFVIKLEEPAYKCKQCNIDITAYQDSVFRHFEYPPFHGILYDFFKCFNIVIGSEMMVDLGGEDDEPMCQVFCVGCDTHIGLNYESADDTLTYNEGNFMINRIKLHGPPVGSDDDDIPGYGFYGSDYESPQNEED